MRSSSRKTLVRNALLIGASGVATVASAQMGCSSPASTTPESALSAQGGGGSSESTGTVGMQLTLPGGEQISSITWSITGPNGESAPVKSGTISVTNSTAIAFLVGGIPAGSGYTITITGTSSEGSVTCVGSAEFNTTTRTAGTTTRPRRS